MSKQWLLDYLRDEPNDIMNWCVSELYILIDCWINLVIRELGGEGMNHALIKDELNKDALNILDLAKDFDFGSKQFFYNLLHVVSYSNWFDIVVKDMMMKKNEYLNVLTNEFNRDGFGYQHSELFEYFSQERRHVLYECDNAGEIVFDLLFIRFLTKMGHKVTIIAKYQPILNDVTVDDVIDLIRDHLVFQDLYQLYLNQDLSIISANDFPVVGKYLPMVTQQYMDAYSQADLIWLKGQGNFQTMPLMNHYFRPYRNLYKKRLVFSFIVKAPIIQYCLNQWVDYKVGIGRQFLDLV